MCQIYHIVCGGCASRYVVSTSLLFQFHCSHITFTGTRTLKNAFGHADGKVEQYRTNLVRLRDNFLARASVITEVAVLESGE
jgi:vancomycin permeability regulator SanA